MKLVSRASGEAVGMWLCSGPGPMSDSAIENRYTQRQVPKNVQAVPTKLCFCLKKEIERRDILGVSRGLSAPRQQSIMLWMVSVDPNQ